MGVEPRHYLLLRKWWERLEPSAQSEALVSVETRLLSECLPEGHEAQVGGGVGVGESTSMLAMAWVE